MQITDSLILRPKILGISGGTGSGKTFLAKKIFDIYPEYKVLLLQQDAYYKDLSHLNPDERKKENFDQPESIDIELFYSQLIKICKGAKVKVPRYDYSRHVRLNSKTIYGNFDIIIIEGLFSLYFKKIRKLLSLKLFIDTCSEIRLERRLKRDQEERGGTYKSIISQYHYVVQPMYIKYIEPTKELADIVVSGEKNVEDIMYNLKPKLDRIIES